MVREAARPAAHSGRTGRMACTAEPGGTYRGGRAPPCYGLAPDPGLRRGCSCVARGFESRSTPTGNGKGTRPRRCRDWPPDACLRRCGESSCPRFVAAGPIGNSHQPLSGGDAGKHFSMLSNSIIREFSIETTPRAGNTASHAG